MENNADNIEKDELSDSSEESVLLNEDTSLEDSVAENVQDSEEQNTDEDSNNEDSIPTDADESYTVEDSESVVTEKEPDKVIEAKPERTRLQKIFDFTELLVFTLAAVLIILSFVFRHSVVDGDSMNNTLYNGEHLIISDLFYTPDYGDIIVFEDYSTSLRKPLIKRVIALGGDEVKIDGNSVYVNGELLKEDYTYYMYQGFSGTKISLTVPEGELFVMGDNRLNSTDSRAFGTIREDTILGKVIFRFYPIKSCGSV